MSLSPPAYPVSLSALHIEKLQAAFGERVQLNVPLARYTAARLGGPADVLLQVNSADELAETARTLWNWELPFLILGGGSNLLVRDAGVRGIVVLNKAKAVRFDEKAERPTVWAESGANFGVLARQAARKGLNGLAWGAGIPGTVGGAVVGNAGAHGGDIAGSLVLAEILHRIEGRASWSADKLMYAYRSSVLKQAPEQAVVLSATLRLVHSPPDGIYAKMEQFLAHRRRTQPPGASMGSIFKNPPGDYAGRLIEAAGLKGACIGGAEISAMHANFFINRGEATAADVCQLIDLARNTVAEQFGVTLELEILII